MDYLLVGLGNPGEKYALTRHNIGFMAIDVLMAEYNCPKPKTKWQGVFARVRSTQAGLIFVQPQTFMNRSGESVSRFVEYYKVGLDHLVVVHDDIDLPFGRIKVVAQGGAGGHNGVRSIFKHVGGSGFCRIKIGVGRPQEKDEGVSMPVDRFVLSRFSPQEQAMLEQVFERVSAAVDVFVRQGVAACMNTINGLPAFG